MLLACHAQTQSKTVAMLWSVLIIFAGALQTQLAFAEHHSSVKQNCFFTSHENIKQKCFQVMVSVLIFSSSQIQQQLAVSLKTIAFRRIKIPAVIRHVPTKVFVPCLTSSAAGLLQLASLAKNDGIEKLYSSFTSYSDIEQKHGEAMVRVLTKKWDELEVRRLEVKLLRASNLPPMDRTVTGKQGTTDAYAILSLVPPRDQVDVLHEESQKEKMSAVGRAITMFEQSWQAFSDAFLGTKQGQAPDPREGEYSRTRSDTKWGTVNPVWEQPLELQVRGGQVDSQGVYINRTAPFTTLRIEMWDHDRLSLDDYIGEATVLLTMLMDGRKHRIMLPMSDPSGIRAGGTQGEVYLELRYGA